MPHWTPPQRHWFHHIKFSLSASQPAHRSRLKQHHPTQHFNCFHKPTTPLVLKIILGNVPRHEHPTFGLTAQSAFARAAWALLVIFYFFVYSKFFGDKTRNQYYENVFLLLARRRRKILLFWAVLQRFSFIFYHFRVNFPAWSQKIYYGSQKFTIGRISLQ